MKSKYIILDEIKLELLKDTNGNTMMFKDKDSAINFAVLSGINGWQVVEVPFGK